MKKTTVLLPLLFAAFFTSSCGLFETDKYKNKAVDAVVKVVKPASQRVLGCDTGAPLAADLAEKLEGLLKVKGPRFSSGMAKSVVGDLCAGAVKLALPLLVDLGDKKLPATWLADGCSLALVGDSVDDLAGRLCMRLE